MSPRFDFACIKCGAIRPDVTVTPRHEVPLCACGGEMRKMPAAPNFTVGGYNAKNGYSNETK